MCGLFQAIPGGCFNQIWCCGQNKRQQLKAAEQGQNANTACLSNAFIMEIAQMNTSTYSFVVLQAFCSRVVAKTFCIIFIKNKMPN